MVVNRGRLSPAHLTIANICSACRANTSAFTSITGVMSATERPMKTRLSKTDNQLAEVFTLQQAHEGFGRIFKTIDNIFTVL